MSDLYVRRRSFMEAEADAYVKATDAEIVAYVANLDGAERAHFCTEHSEYGGPKRCQTGAQIAPDVCRMVSGIFLPDKETP